MKKKILLSVCFALSLIPMLWNQYGGSKGVQEISGLINLFSPIGILSVLLFILGVWVPLRSRTANKLLGALGTAGMVASEIHRFLTWHVLTITGEISLQTSFRLAFPSFYAGLAVSCAMVIAYFIILKAVKD